MSLRDLVKSKPKRVRFTRTLNRDQVRRMKKRGYDAERELVKMFRRAGFHALRVPVSAPSNEPLPDVFAINYKRKQVNKLFDFLDIHKIYPRRYAILAAKFRYKGWVFMIPEKSGDYSLRMGEGIDFRELIKRVD